MHPILPQGSILGTKLNTIHYKETSMQIQNK